MGRWAGLAAVLLALGAASGDAAAQAAGAGGAAGAAGAAQAPRASAGAVREYSVHSAAYGRDRRFWVYTPPGYAPGRSYDLLVAFDGADYRDTIPLPQMLDSLLHAGKAPAFVAVLVDDYDRAARLEDLANHARFVHFLADELLPRVRAGWSVTRDPQRTIVTGSSAGGLAAAYVALERPDLFGNVLSQSGAFWRGAEGSNGAPYEWLTARYAAAPHRPLHILLDVGELETHPTAGSGPSILEANRRLRDVLRSKGYDLRYTEVPGGVHAPQTWRPRLPGDLADLVRDWPR